MRLCRVFRSADDIQPAIDRLMENGYLAGKPAEETGTKGRPSVVYLVNPHIYDTDADILQPDRT